MEVNRNKSL